MSLPIRDWPTSPPSVLSSPAFYTGLDASVVSSILPSFFNPPALPSPMYLWPRNINWNRDLRDLKYVISSAYTESLT
jgi:hypothetical protein